MIRTLEIDFEHGTWWSGNNPSEEAENFVLSSRSLSFYPSFLIHRLASRLTYVNASVDRERVEFGVARGLEQARRMRACMDVQVYTYAWAHKYASLVGRLTPTLFLLLLLLPGAHISERGGCNVSTRFHLWIRCLLTQYAESCVYVAGVHITGRR